MPAVGLTQGADARSYLCRLETGGATVAGTVERERERACGGCLCAFAQNRVTAVHVVAEAATAARPFDDDRAGETAVMWG